MARYLVTYQKIETAYAYVHADSPEQAAILAEDGIPGEFDISWSNEVSPRMGVENVQLVDEAKDAEERAFYEANSERLADHE